MTRWRRPFFTADLVAKGSSLPEVRSKARPSAHEMSSLSPSLSLSRLFSQLEMPLHLFQSVTNSSASRSAVVRRHRGTIRATLKVFKRPRKVKIKRKRVEFFVRYNFDTIDLAKNEFLEFEGQK